MHKRVGESISVTLEPPDAFGEYDPEMIRDRAASPSLPPDVDRRRALWSRSRTGTKSCGASPTLPTAKRCWTATTKLAGQRLRFDCTVVDIRPATKEEITHGHVHGAGGHHHH